MRFMSICRRVDNDAKIVPHSATIRTKGIKYKQALGTKPSEKRINPYPPNFNKILANIIDPIVGASTCASGNQIWNGTIGILTANVKNNSTHKNFWNTNV